MVELEKQRKFLVFVLFSQVYSTTFVKIYIKIISSHFQYQCKKITNNSQCNSILLLTFPIKKFDK